MPKQKSNFTLLFEELYDYYIEHRDNDMTWHKIFEKLNDYIYIQIYKSQLFKAHYYEMKQELRIAILSAFRTYDASKGASLHTWATMFCKQSIIRFIKRESENTYNELVGVNQSEDAWGVDKDGQEILEEKEFDSKEGEYMKRLSKMLGGPIEADVFAMRNGLFGYPEMKIEEIAEETSFSHKTIYCINIRNNKKLRELRENDPNALEDLLK